jgi:glycosyltransferase involved in cell wall biosynthesis
MKITFPCGTFYPSNLGGPANTLYWHACGLKSLNNKVVVITTSIGIKDDAVLFEKFVDTKAGEVYYGLGGSTQIKTIFKAFNKSKSSEIVHLNSLFNLLSIFTFVFLKFNNSKVKIVWSPRGELQEGALVYSKIKKKLLLSFLPRLTREVLFHATSEDEKKRILKFFPKVRTTVFPNYILPAKRLLNIKVKNQFLFLGRIHEIKAIHKLVEGLSISKQFLDKEFKLIIAGSFEERHEEYYKKLEILIEKLKLTERVKFVGNVRGIDKENLIAESYALILPSVSENFGNVVVESLNQGTPVIASLGTPWAVLEEKNAGLHVSNNPVELGRAIDEVIGLSSNAYSEMRKNAVNLLDEKFDVNKNIHKWENIYKSL